MPSLVQGEQNDQLGLALDLAGEAQLPVGSYTVGDVSNALAGHPASAAIAAAHIVGLSLGGLVGQQLAASNPNLVTSLVIADSVDRYPTEAPAQWQGRAHQARQAGVSSMIPALLSMWLTDEAIAAAGEAEGYARAAFERMSPEGYALACELLADADPSAMLGQIRCPPLVLCGDDDGLAFCDAAPRLAGSTPRAEVKWITGARHAQALERPEAFADLVTAFVDDVEARS